MIRLKNVSKYYYGKGVVATGFSKVNLELNLGEFVAITGESGSGKTTLLNVISGLDTYEEGEMYINGEETSHYIAKDFEEYRRKNIGNIYQNFNLVNSYTVYQNIALSLMLNGEKNIKPRVLELIKKVDLYSFRNTKVSKLSGGQKQRVAIARALAKDVPIIIADEPTGNLDKKSALGIMKLLSELSHDKLVIIVTHNYEQVAPYVTRKITMHDGRILEDVKLKNVEKVENLSSANIHNISIWNRVRLGVRNTFNIIPKFILLFFVFSFIVGSLMSEYATFKKDEVLAQEEGYNYIFDSSNLKRIVLKKQDNSVFQDEDIQQIQSLKEVDYVVLNDLLLDVNRDIRDSDFHYWFSCKTHSMSNYYGKVDAGRMPENEREAILVINEDSYLFNGNASDILEKDYYFVDEVNYDYKDENLKIKIVGLQYDDDIPNGDTYLYVGDEILRILNYQIHKEFSHIFVRFQGKKYTNYSYSPMFQVNPSDFVPTGEAYISESHNALCPKNTCLWTNFEVLNENLYFTDSKTFIVSKTFNKNSIGNLLNLNGYKKETYDYEWDGKIFINSTDYESLFSKGTFQISVFAKDKKDVDVVAKKLDKMNYSTLKIKDTLVKFGVSEFLAIIKTVLTIALVITLFFISYFIIKIILKSRNHYFSVVRMLGGEKKITRQLLSIELFVVSNIAYFLFLFLVYLNSRHVFSVEILQDIYDYLTFQDYFLLYLILCGMALLSSMRYSRKLFKNSVMVSFREEV